MNQAITHLDIQAFNPVGKENQLQNNLQESERRFRDLVELLPVIVFETDTECRVTFVNDVGADLLGYSKEEVLGRPFSHFVAPEDVNRILSTARNVMSGKFLGDNEFVIIKKDGTRISTFIQSAPNKNSRGELIGLRGIIADIGKQKNIEQGLRQSEQKYRALINNIKLGIVRTTPGDDGIFLEFNKTLEEMSGYSREELFAMKVVDLYANPAKRQEYQESIIRTGETIYAEGKLKKKDGREILINGTLTPVRDAQGNILYLDGILEDITERKRAEESVWESERRFRELADLLPVIAFESNLKGELVYVNNYAFSLFGHAKEEFLGRPIYSFVAPEDRERSISNARKVLTGEFLGNNEYIAVKKDGRRFAVLIQTVPIKNSRGELTGIRGILADIHNQKEIEAELRESEAFSTGLFMNSPNPILVTNPDDSIRNVNSAFEALTGFSSRELVGLKFPFPWWPPEKHGQYGEKDAYNGIDGTFERERYYRKKNGEIFWAFIKIRRVEDKGQLKYFITNWVDITERKEMEERIVDLYRKEKAERQELQEEAKARGLFIDVLAHELRTPLTPILASTGMLKDFTGGQINPIQKKLTDNIYNSTQTLAKRLEELLDLARYSRGTFNLNIQPTDLSQFIEGVLARFKPSLQHKCQTLLEELPESLPEAELDASRLEQVIINLLSNACKFSPEKDTVLFRVSLENRAFQVDVQDNGIGIPYDSQESLFQPYHRVEQDRQQFPGLGLGLAVSKQIVEAHGGKIWLVSQPGRGSTFSFRIPLTKS
jgi:PAS domain S-box-containing protein